MEQKPLTSVHEVTGIDYGHLCVESRGLFESPRFDFTNPHKVLLTASNALALQVASRHTKYALVQVESWATTPTTGEPDGAEVDEEDCRRRVNPGSGTVSVIWPVRSVGE
ncbi:hypothetical protein LWC34_10725 [Kibdelosporangium philippinense]|uniref:Uncharacterized protein n=1 Tax=Kibdelosporangium philippinense TaxID=211113 RepID=A0ABS8Z5Y5_9PSEU|nr:hypothetical protein [Kibdelosporangium philippinense]MCE7003299.1 hypothetical protein [Kibdelosporangium philippinense]